MRVFSRTRDQASGTAMDSIGQIIKCLGRRRITVSVEKDMTILTIWFRDPPHGQRIAGLQLDKAETQKLLRTLTEILANG